MVIRVFVDTMLSGRYVNLVSDAQKILDSSESMKVRNLPWLGQYPVVVHLKCGFTSMH